MALSDLTDLAVRKAIAEFKQLGRTAFLEKYGFGKAREYSLELDGQLYDSKAIAGAAHGYLAGQMPLAAREFSGGEATVKKTLEDLGFKVVTTNSFDLPSPGTVLTNAELSRRFAVGTMGGMRRSTKNKLLVLISDPFKGLYQDRWEGDVLHYTGMGPTGDQSLTYAQNRTLAESRNTGISLHFLEALELHKYTYAGEVELVDDPYQEEQLDDPGNIRKVWMFPIKVKKGGLIPTLSEDQSRAIEESHSRLARKLTMEQLKLRAEKAKKKPSVRMAQTPAFVRDAAVSEYAKRLAGGKCDLCQKPAPFRNKHREAYLESHHIVWLAKGGEDTIANTVALCPNCHRKMHVVNDRKDIERLQLHATKRTPTPPS